MSNDIPIQHAGNAPVNIQIRSGPTYLISLKQGVTSPYFVATKIDEGPQFVKAVGFFAKKEGQEAKIITGHAKMLASAKIEDFIEIQFPWHQVNSIQNLIYRHKGIK